MCRTHTQRVQSIQVIMYSMNTAKRTVIRNTDLYVFNEHRSLRVAHTHTASNQYGPYVLNEYSNTHCEVSVFNEYSDPYVRHIMTCIR